MEIVRLQIILILPQFTFLTQSKQTICKRKIYLKSFVMSCVSRKRFHSSEDEYLNVIPSKRLHMDCPTKTKQNVPFNAFKNFSTKTEINIPTKKIKGEKLPQIPTDFMNGLPVLLDSDESDSDTDQVQTSQRKTAKTVTQDNRNMFSYGQLQDICCDMMKQSYDRLREEYEVKLTKAMAEQYDTFIKFTHDQMHREIGHNPSYLK